MTYNLIDEYECGNISFDELSEEIWGYGQRLIELVGEDKFEYYVQLVINEFANSNKKRT